MAVDGNNLNLVKVINALGVTMEEFFSERFDN